MTGQTECQTEGSLGPTKPPKTPSCLSGRDKWECVGGSKTDDRNEMEMQWAATILNSMVSDQALPPWIPSSLALASCLAGLFNRHCLGAEQMVPSYRHIGFSLLLPFAPGLLSRLVQL